MRSRDAPNNVSTLQQQEEGGSFAPASTFGGNPPAQNSTTAVPTIDQGGSTAPPASPFGGMWVLGLMFVVVYMFLIRPERKRQKAQTALRDSLKKGDKVITSGGMHAQVAALDEGTVTLKVDDGTRMKFSRNAIVHIASPQGEDAPAAKG